MTAGADVATQRARTTNPRASWGRRGRLGHSPVVGLALALVSAALFGTAGAVGKGLLVEGWSPGAAVTVRVLLGALILAGPAAYALRGRWHLLASRAAWVKIGLFGLVAVAGCQLFYFLAVQRLTVGVALMLEYLAPILVVAWLWLSHGHRPRPLTVIGIVLALGGLLLVLDVLGEVRISGAGVAWGLLAAVGLAVYFVIGADESTGLPPIVFSCLGLATGGVALGLAGLVGLVPMQGSLSDVQMAGVQVAWWVPMAWLGLCAAALAYATGIAANRHLGAKFASFVGLTEVLFAVLWAWLLLGELPARVQLLGGVLILLGVSCVKADERPLEPVTTITIEPVPTDR